MAPLYLNFHCMKTCTCIASIHNMTHCTWIALNYNTTPLYMNHNMTPLYLNCTVIKALTQLICCPNGPTLDVANKGGHIWAITAAQVGMYKSRGLSHIPQLALKDPLANEYCIIWNLQWLTYCDDFMVSYLLFQSSHLDPFTISDLVKTWGIGLHEIWNLVKGAERS